MKAFETGVYRNFFAEIGITEEEIDRRLKEIVDTFFYGDDDKRVYYPAEPDMLRPHLIGCGINRDGIAALIESAKAAELGVESFEADLETIMVHLEKEGEA